MKKIQPSRIFLLTLIALLPVNLGKHFEFSGSYVYGNLIDYLVPTLYVQDILALLLLIALILERKRILLEGPIKKIAMFLGVLLLSSLFASRALPSLWFFFRIFLYTVVGIYVYKWVDLKKEGRLIQKILAVQLLFVSVLAIAQFFVRGSVFDNYLFLGEQPYSLSTPQITKEVLLGRVFLPPMGLFRHPNILSGYLAILLVFVVFWFPKNKLSIACLVLGMVAFLLTFSVFTWAAFFATLVLYKFLKDKRKIMYIYLLAASLILLVPFFPFSSDNASFYRRDSLLAASYRIAGKFPVLGVGTNNFTSYVDDFQISNDIRFTQPVHNVFALILAESGIFAFFLFILIFFDSYSAAAKKGDVPLLLAFSAALLLMSFDHYFWTIHQTTLILFILFGLSWKHSYGQGK
ncbi:MAG: hypothetical protein KatS3mg101_0035 [Patescibacteria group bacterium]|nr:MAG: hypothetical protein KatS3mg101_0035 [Patescibacteria group bacterium]